MESGICHGDILRRKLWFHMASFGPVPVPSTIQYKEQGISVLHFTGVRNEHQSSLALPDRLAGPFHPNKQLAKWYSASQQVACNAIVWLTHISGGITRIYFAYMGKVGTNLRQKIGLCVGVRITWITRDWMQFEYCRPCLKRRALNTLRKATTSSIDDKCGTNHRRKVRQSLTPENWKNKNA